MEIHLKMIASGIMENAGLKIVLMLQVQIILILYVIHFYQNALLEVDQPV